MDNPTFDSLKAHELNPRTMSKQQADALYHSLTHFGDLGGIVLNEANGKLVGGHRRTDTFNRLGGEKNITITQRWDEPKAAGTVAVGFIGYGNEYYSYRVVRWSEETHLAAMVAANRVGGDWELEKLSDVNELIKQANADLLKLTGQTDDELEKLNQLGSAPEESKSDDSRIRMDFKMTDDQSIVVDQAIAEISARMTLGNDGNDDLRANAIVQICHAYLASLNDDQPKDQPADNPATTIQS